MKIFLILILLALPAFGQWSANIISNGNFDDVADQTYEWNDFNCNFVQLASYEGRDNVMLFEVGTGGYPYVRQTFGDLSFGRTIDRLTYTDSLRAGRIYNYAFYSYWPSTNVVWTDGIRIRVLTENDYVGDIQKNIDSWGLYEIEDLAKPVASKYFSLWGWGPGAAANDSLLADSIVIREKLDAMYVNYETGFVEGWGNTVHPVKTYEEAGTRTSDPWHSQALYRMDYQGNWQQADTANGEMMNFNSCMQINTDSSEYIADISSFRAGMRDQYGFISFWFQLDTLASEFGATQWLISLGDSLGGNYAIRFTVTTANKLYIETRENSSNMIVRYIDKPLSKNRPYHVVFGSDQTQNLTWLNGIKYPTVVQTSVGAKTEYWLEDCRVDDYADVIILGGYEYHANWGDHPSYLRIDNLLMSQTIPTAAIVRKLYNHGKAIEATHESYASSGWYFTFDAGDGHRSYSSAGSAWDFYFTSLFSPSKIVREPTWNGELFNYTSRSLHRNDTRLRRVTK